MKTMKQQDFTTTILVDQTPQEAYKAINNVRGWWSENIEGDTDKPGGAFNYHYKDVHLTKIKVTGLEPGKKVSWHVLDNYFQFTKDKEEWKDTHIVFDIAAKNGKTEVRFTHQGLTPKDECFDICNDAWTHYIKDSLRDLIATGKGKPTPKDTESAFNEGLLARKK